jgi:hypothetical protein
MKSILVLGLCAMSGLAAACGGSSSNPVVGGCETHSSPTFKIGTSAQDGSYTADLTDNSMVKMTYGSQGGCHLWIAFRTDGFAGKGGSISYTLTDLDMSNAQISMMSNVMADFAPDANAPHMCEVGAFKAFMLMAKARENHHVKLDVTITDSTNATATKTVNNVMVLWPDVIAGQDRTMACGQM